MLKWNGWSGQANFCSNFCSDDYIDFIIMTAFEVYRPVKFYPRLRERIIKVDRQK